MVVGALRIPYPTKKDMHKNYNISNRRIGVGTSSIQSVKFRPFTELDGPQAKCKIEETGRKEDSKCNQ